MEAILPWMGPHAKPEETASPQNASLSLGECPSLWFHIWEHSLPRLGPRIQGVLCLQNEWHLPVSSVPQAEPGRPWSPKDIFVSTFSYSKYKDSLTPTTGSRVKAKRIRQNAKKASEGKPTQHRSKQTMEIKKQRACQLYQLKEKKKKKSQENFNIITMTGIWPGRFISRGKTTSTCPTGQKTVCYGDVYWSRLIIEFPR